MQVLMAILVELLADNDELDVVWTPELHEFLKDCCDLGIALGPGVKDRLGF